MAPLSPIDHPEPPDQPRSSGSGYPPPGTPYYTPLTLPLSLETTAATKPTGVVPTGPCTPRFYATTPGCLASIQATDAWSMAAAVPSGPATAGEGAPRRTLALPFSAAGRLSFPSFTPSNLAQLLTRASTSPSPAAAGQCRSQSVPSVLLIDTRIPSQFQASHVIDSINLSVPSALLKRPNFTLDRIVTMLTDPVAKARLSHWLEHTHIVIIDQNSPYLAQQGVVSHLCQKFSDPQSKVHVGWLRGGFDAFALRFPVLCVASDSSDASKSLLHADVLSGSLSPTVPTMGSTANSLTIQPGSLSHLFADARQRPLDSFFLSYRHNNEPVPAAPASSSSPHSPAARVRAPPRFPQATLPSGQPTVSPYLTTAAVATTGPRYLESHFERLRTREDTQIQTMITHQGDTCKANPLSIVHGLEGGTKNRYRNILPYDYTRVPLHDPDSGGYINASFITAPRAGQHYISTQGPLPATVSDFWTMVWEQGSRVILMLTRETERNHTACHRYWPQLGEPESLQIGTHLTVMMAAEGSLPSDPEITIRILRLRNTGGDRGGGIGHRESKTSVRIVVQLQYTGWPDFGAPASPVSVLRLRDLARLVQPESSSDSPWIVHCSAGCGRTGAFCVIDAVSRCPPTHTGNPEHDDPIFTTVSHFRQQRTSMVQSSVQFAFCYEALLWEQLGDYDAQSMMQTLTPVLQALLVQAGATDLLPLTAGTTPAAPTASLTSSSMSTSSTLSAESFDHGTTALSIHPPPLRMEATPDYFSLPPEQFRSPGSPRAFHAPNSPLILPSMTIPSHTLRRQATTSRMGPPTTPFHPHHHHHHHSTGCSDKVTSPNSGNHHPNIVVHSPGSSGSSGGGTRGASLGHHGPSHLASSIMTSSLSPSLTEAFFARNSNMSSPLSSPNC